MTDSRTLRPSGTVIDNVGGYSPSGAATIAAALSDNSDSSKVSGVNNGTLVLAFTSYTLGPQERVLRARARVRANAFGSADLYVTFGNFTDGTWHTEDHFVVGAPIGVFFGTYYDGLPGGVEIGQGFLDTLQVKIHSPDAPTLAVIEEYIDFDVVHQPVVTLTAPALNSVNPDTSHQPVVRWTSQANDGAVQTKYRIKVFNRAINPSANWADTAGLVWDSLATASSGTSRTISAKLPNGSWRVLIQIAKDFNGTDWWSATDATNFTISDTLAIPTLLGPTGPVSTPWPTLQAHIIQSSFGAAGLVKARWRISKDAAFGSGVTSYESALISAPSGGGGVTVFHTVIEGEQTLDQGTWYLEAKTVDEMGDESGWAGPVSFVVTHPLQSTNRTPATGTNAPIGTVDFHWQTLSTFPDAAQTASRIVVRKVSDQSIVFDTGKQANTLTAWSQAGVVFQGAVEWRLTLWDEDDIAGPDSPWQQFDLVDAPDVAFTSPTDGGTVTFAHPTVTWSYVSGGGGVQKTKRVRVYNAADVLVYDSGPITSAVHSQALTGPDFFVQGQTFRLDLLVTDTADVEGTATATITVVFPPPSAPAGFTVTKLTLPNPAADAGPFRIALIEYAHLTWTGSGLGNDFDYYEVSRATVNSRLEVLEPERVIARIIEEGSPYFNDVECARSPDSSAISLYKVRVKSKTLGLGAQTPNSNATVLTGDDCDVYLTSNYTPELSVAYQDRGPYDFDVGENDLVKVRRIFGKSKPLMFRPYNGEGDEFSRTLLLGMATNGGAVKPAADTGRIVYAPLLARIRDATSPYVVVTDGMGYRWFAGLKFGGGTYAKEVGQYVGKIDITEVEDPEPVIAEVPWTDQGS